MSRATFARVRGERERQKSESSLVVGSGGDSVTQRENFIFCARVAGGPRCERMNDLSVRVEATRSPSHRPQNGYEAEERTKLYLSRISRFIEAEHMQAEIPDT